MNMNKALQNLYHAVSGSTTTKVNISKLLVDIHYAITGVESSVKNNWSRIIDSMATNWPEGGGGGSSDFSTAQVTFVKESGGVMNINMPYALDANPEQGNPDVAMSGINLLSVDTVVCNAILYKGSCFLDYSSYPTINIVITGSASKIFDGAILITGDCTLTISE